MRLSAPPAARPYACGPRRSGPRRRRSSPHGRPLTMTARTRQPRSSLAWTATSSTTGKAIPTSRSTGSNPTTRPAADRQAPSRPGCRLRRTSRGIATATTRSGGHDSDSGRVAAARRGILPGRLSAAKSAGGLSTPIPAGRLLHSTSIRRLPPATARRLSAARSTWQLPRATGRLQPPGRVPAWGLPRRVCWLSARCRWSPAQEEPRHDHRDRRGSCALAGGNRRRHPGAHPGRRHPTGCDDHANTHRRADRYQLEKSGTGYARLSNGDQLFLGQAIAVDPGTNPEQLCDAWHRKITEGQANGQFGKPETADLNTKNLEGATCTGMFTASNGSGSQDVVVFSLVSVRSDGVTAIGTMYLSKDADSDQLNKDFTAMMNSMLQDQATGG